MAKYYNTSSGSLAVGLRRGESASLPGKQWSFIAPEDEGSEDLIRAVKLGFLVRSTIDDEVEEVKPAAPTETVEPTKVPSALVFVAEPEKAETPASVESPPAEATETEEKTSDSRRRRS